MSTVRFDDKRTTVSSLEISVRRESAENAWCSYCGRESPAFFLIENVNVGPLAGVRQRLLCCLECGSGLSREIEKGAA